MSQPGVSYKRYRFPPPVIAILANRPHPEQAFRTCLGILRMFKQVDRQRVEAASARAVAVAAFTYKSIAAVLARLPSHSPAAAEETEIDRPNL